jgi:hypothetical protein
MVFASLGLDSAGAAVPFVTGWAERAEGDPIEADAELIARPPQRIEAAVCERPRP